MCYGLLVHTCQMLSEGPQPGVLRQGWLTLLAPGLLGSHMFRLLPLFYGYVLKLHDIMHAINYTIPQNPKL